MMVLFQNRIIYMPRMPPGARAERIADYTPFCAGIEWTEERIRSSDGTQLALCVSSVQSGNCKARGESKSGWEPRQVYILYFQGSS